MNKLLKFKPPSAGVREAPERVPAGLHSLQYGACSWIVCLSCTIAFAASLAARADAPVPSIAISPAVEDNQKVIHALVTIESKPIKNVKVRLAVKRTFGLLPLGEDTTDDEGTAAAPFPKDLPGNERGEFEVIATLTAPETYAGVTASQMVPGGIPIRSAASSSFPRALWGSSAPWPLAITVVVLIGGVWLTYVRVLGLIFAIRKAGRT